MRRLSDVGKGSVFALCGYGAHVSISEERRLHEQICLLPKGLDDKVA